MLLPQGRPFVFAVLIHRSPFNTVACVSDEISDENVTLLTPDFAWARSLCSEVIVCEKSGCGAIGFSFKSVTYRCGCNAFGWKSDCAAMLFSPFFIKAIQFHVKPQKRGIKALHFMMEGSLLVWLRCGISLS